MAMAWMSRLRTGGTTLMLTNKTFIERLIDYNTGQGTTVPTPPTEDDTTPPTPPPPDTRALVIADLVEIELRARHIRELLG